VNELMQMGVIVSDEVTTSTVSKYGEGIFDAPGVITVVSKHEIAQFGANTLWEVLQRVPSIIPMYSSILDNSTFSIRGSKPKVTDKNLLLLLNGRPMLRESWGMHIYQALIDMIPIEMVEKIEIVRGPGSVLYGSSAYSGVINIITNLPGFSSKKFYLQSSTRVGSFETLGSDLILTAKIGKLIVTSGFNTMQSTGWDFEGIGEDNKSISTKIGKKNYGFTNTIRYFYKHFSFKQ
jgi:outer membrane cobalamin receptor